MKSRYALTLCALLLSGVAHAADVPERDSKFMQTEAQGGRYELTIAKLAEQKATKADIKSYAQMIVTDHTALNNELAQLAKSKGVTLPPEMTDKQQAELKKLEGLSGEAFDGEYKKETTRINDEDKQDDQKELSAVTDPEIKAFVEKLQQADTKHYKAGEKL